MAPVDITHHSANSNNDESANASVQSLNRAMELPVVKSAVFYASDLYNRVKGVNPMLESGLARAEQTVLLVADSAKPVILRFEGPINYADSLVCHGLDKLEEKVPAIKKSPDELASAGWTTYEALRSYGTETIGSLRFYVTSQVEKASSTPYAQAVLKTVDTAVDLTDHVIDRYLPASEEEEKEVEENATEKTNSNGEVVNDSSERNLEQLAEKVGYISGKVRRRLSRYDLILPQRVLELIGNQNVSNVEPVNHQ